MDENNLKYIIYYQSSNNDEEKAEVHKDNTHGSISHHVKLDEGLRRGGYISFLTGVFFSFFLHLLPPGLWNMVFRKAEV